MVRRVQGENMMRKVSVLFLCALMLFPFDLAALVQNRKAFAAMDSATADETAVTPPPPAPEAREALTGDSVVYLDAELLVPRPEEDTDSVLTVVEDENSPYGLDGKIPFNPDPTRAVWMSALFPGLGQVYNRRYWKLPIIVAGFMGIGYGTSWNNKQYSEYTQGYRDLLDSDPSTDSYMNFFPPTTKEEDLDKTWLSNVMKSRKDYYRRNRDLCIICMVALYALCMIDAYVDASLAHFDLSPDLSMDVAPAVLVNPDGGRARMSLGLNWAFTF